jgi:hypothetical protein
MDFDDLFENKRRHMKYNYYEGNHYPENSYEDKYSHRMPGKGNYALIILDRIWNSRKLRFLLILAVIIFIVILITVLILIIPLVTGIIDSVSKAGIKGVLEEITALITGLWNGSGNK